MVKTKSGNHVISEAQNNQNKQRRDQAVQRLYDDSFRRMLDRESREREKERLEMEHVQSKPRLLTSTQNHSVASYYDEESDAYTEDQSASEAYVAAQKPIHLRYQEVLQKKEHKLKQIQELQKMKEIEKDPESHGFASHKPVINPKSVQMLEKSGKIADDFLQRTQNMKDKFDHNKESATKEADKRVKNACPFKPVINKASK